MICFADSETDIDLLEPVEKVLNTDPRVYRTRGQQGLPAFGLRRGADIAVPSRLYIPKKFFDEFAILTTIRSSDIDGGYLFAVVNPFDTVVELGLLIESAGK